MSKTYRNTFDGKVRAEIYSKKFRDILRKARGVYLEKVKGFKKVFLPTGITEIDKLSHEHKIRLELFIRHIYEASATKKEVRITSIKDYYFSLYQKLTNSIEKDDRLTMYTVVNFHKMEILNFILYPFEILKLFFKVDKVKKGKHLIITCKTGRTLQQILKSEDVPIEATLILTDKKVKAKKICKKERKIRSSTPRRITAEKKCKAKLRKSRMRFENLRFTQEILSTPIKYILEDFELFGTT